MGDNLERILRENDLRLRRAARDDATLRSMMDGWDLLAAGIQPETPSPTGVDEFPFRDARGIYRYRKGKSRRKTSRKGKSRIRTSKRTTSKKGKSRRRKSRRKSSK
jgi:hypothetical protein